MRTEPGDMDDDEIVRKHSDLLRIQKGYTRTGNTALAQDVAKRRQELWVEAKTRDIERRLL
jgi:hypothetical protein